MKNSVTIFILCLMLAVPVLADDGHEEHGFMEQAEAIINAEIPCNLLSEEQLEIIGEYYMEQMHPGEGHERMDKMMGGHGSDSLLQAHISMAKRFYCKESSSSGIMGTFNQESINNNGGMMNMMHMGYGMMGVGSFLVSLLYVAIVAFVFGIVFWWTYNLMIKKTKKKKN